MLGQHSATKLYHQSKDYNFTDKETKDLEVNQLVECHTINQ
jgi:hypothetical protein